MRGDPGLAWLWGEIRSRPSDPYLLTVTSSCRPHCSTVTLTWDAPDGQLIVRPVPRTWDPDFRQTSLLWPPAEPGGYSLIVDGTAAGNQAAGEPVLIVTVTRAVLHRRGPAAGSDSACGSDCVPLVG